MERDYKEFIGRSMSQVEELLPEPTGVQPEYSYDEGIKCVVFDIYGTLLISSSGDIDQANVNTQNLSTTLQNAGFIINEPEKIESILNTFTDTVKLHQNFARQNGIPYPEVNIIQVWKDTLVVALHRKIISQNEDTNLLKHIFEFELLSNKVYPMPGMRSVLEQISMQTPGMGIVSNAQFYTPIMMNYFLRGEVKDKEDIDLFDPLISFFSYKLSIAKPDTTMFTQLSQKINKIYKLKPSEILFVGNDMLKDIYAADAAGLKTALFAGDKRSLRMRENDEKVGNLKPTYTITELSQLLNILGI